MATAHLLAIEAAEEAREDVLIGEPPLHRVVQAHREEVLLKPSETIRSHQKPSEAIRSHQKPSSRGSPPWACRAP